MIVSRRSLLAVPLLGLLAACGDDSSPSAPAGSSGAAAAPPKTPFKDPHPLLITFSGTKVKDYVSEYVPDMSLTADMSNGSPRLEADKQELDRFVAFLGTKGVSSNAFFGAGGVERVLNLRYPMGSGLEHEVSLALAIAAKALGVKSDELNPPKAGVPFVDVVTQAQLNADNKLASTIQYLDDANDTLGFTETATVDRPYVFIGKGGQVLSTPSELKASQTRRLYIDAERMVELQRRAGMRRWIGPDTLLQALGELHDTLR
ncbi:hypothetical protein ACFFX1_13980 [Dactylosporangium sucinum]|uniref:Lipoprotein n=1 Tax=Dactylosporangium sucinum TaxID=1424081 RepID=A0A917U8U0_9ACTN|nr:hypothetical protein [Dactylosporangium sucinum]GGM66678.1 hypothetical protein GCM10007977_080370 [Dactylosporangium sucinum]